MNARRSFLAPAAPSDRDMLSVLARLTPKAKANLIACQPDCDLEPETDACDAGDCGGLILRGDRLAGDCTDAEAEDEFSPGEDEPRFPDTLRSGQEGLVQVQRQTVMAVVYRRGQPPRAQRMRCIPWRRVRRLRVAPYQNHIMGPAWDRAG